MEPTALNITASPNTPGLLAGRDLTASEQMRCCREIESLARQLERPLAEIAMIYAAVYADLKSRAQVTDYLPIFVARKVRACLDRLPAFKCGKAVKGGGLSTALE